MWWTNIIIVLLLLQSLCIHGIDGNANRRRRRRQTSGSLYGTNANLGASAPAGYNHPENTNINGIRLSNPDARDLYGNPLIPSSNTDNSLNSVNSYNQPRPQQQQVYGTNDQSALNSLYSGSNFYLGSGTNQLLQDANGNLLPPGSAGSSFYSSSNTQMAYPANPNQVLTNKDMYGTLSNSNNNRQGYNSYQLPNGNTYSGPMNTNNNLLPNSNTYGGPMNTNNNLLPNSNTYGGPMNTNNNLLPNSNTYGGPMNNNNNLYPNSNTYSGSIGSNAQLIPNSNTYSGYKGTSDWSNTNNYNRYGQNSANNYYPNRDTNYNYNNRYSNPYPYGNSYRLTTSILMIFLSFFATIILHL